MLPWRLPPPRYCTNIRRSVQRVVTKMINTSSFPANKIPILIAVRLHHFTLLTWLISNHSCNVNFKSSAAASKCVKQQYFLSIPHFPLNFPKKWTTNSFLKKGFEIENSLAVNWLVTICENHHNRGSRSFNLAPASIRRYFPFWCLCLFQKPLYRAMAKEIKRDRNVTCV